MKKCKKGKTKTSKRQCPVRSSVKMREESPNGIRNFTTEGMSHLWKRWVLSLK